MNRTPVSQTLLKSIVRIHHLSKSTFSSLQTLTDSRANSLVNPLYNFLPCTQNPSKIVDIICTNLKVKHKKSLLEKDMIPHLGTQEISRVLLRCQSDSSAAHTFFIWVKNDLGLVPNVHNYCLMLHILAWSHNLSQTMNLLSELIDLNKSQFGRVSIFENLVLCTEECSFEPVVFDILLKAYLKAGMVRDSLVTFRKMIKLGFVPKIVSINFLLNALLTLNRIDECWEVYEEMGKIGVSGNTFTFNILAHVLCKSGESIEKVNEFLEKMEEEEAFEPDIVTYNTLIDSYVKKRRVKDALYLFNIMSIRRVTPDLFTYTSLIHGFCREKNLREAHKLFFRMVKIGLHPDVYCYNTLIRGYVDAEMMKEVRFLVHDMITKGVSPNKFTCSVLVEGYKKKNMLISAVNLIVELQRFGVLVSRDIEVDLVVALCRGGKPFAAKSLWERMEQDGNKDHNLGIYNELVVSFCKYDHIKEAIQLKDEMFFKKIKANLITYREIIRCLCRLNRSMEGEALMMEMAEFGIIPDVEICRSLIIGYCKEKNSNQGESLLRLFAKEFKICDIECYNAVLKVICEEKLEISKLMEFQERMRKIGFIPNSLSFKHAIGGLSTSTNMLSKC